MYDLTNTKTTGSVVMRVNLQAIDFLGVRKFALSDR